MVAYMTVFSVWPFKLAVIAFTAWWLLHIGWRATGIAVITLFVLVSMDHLSEVSAEHLKPD